MRWLPTLCFTCIGIYMPPPAMARTWTDSKGRKLEADFGGEAGASIKLKMPDGSVVDFPLARLSAEDQAFVTLQRKPPTPEPPPEPPQPEEHFPVFDYGVPKVDEASARGRWVHTWGPLKVTAPSAIERERFEKAFRPVLGAQRILEHLGLPPETMPGAKEPMSIALYATAAEAAKAGSAPNAMAICIRPSGRLFASMSLYGLADNPEPLITKANQSAEELVIGKSLQFQRHAWRGFFRGWLDTAITEYARMIPWQNGWPQAGQARTMIKKLQADLAKEKTLLITPALVDEVITTPGTQIGPGDSYRPQRVASLLTLFYLRHIHGSGEGRELKQALETAGSKVAAWRGYLAGMARYEEAWEAIKADPNTVIHPDGRYSVPASYEAPASPIAPFPPADIAAAATSLNDALRTLLGDKAGQTVIAGLQKAGFTQGITMDVNEVAALYKNGSPGGEGGYVPRDVTPDYSKVRSTKSHPPLESRLWPVEVVMGRSVPTPTVVAGNPGSAVYRLGRFQFETGADLSVPLVKEVARVFVGMEELFQQLPWNLPPLPPKDKCFEARLYPSMAAYQEIAPAMSGGFYSLKEKVFHVPYETLGMAKDSKGGWSKPAAFNPDTLMHELTHMMMDRVLPVLPIWVAEGSAEYVEAIPIRNGTLRLADLPQAIKSYIAEMDGYQAKAGNPALYSASTRGLINTLHMTHTSWDKSIASGMMVRPGTRERKADIVIPPPPPSSPVTSGGSLGPARIIRPPVLPPVVMPQVMIRGPEQTQARIAVQRHLYLHSCLLFYYFVHLDNPSRRGDPMLPFLDLASDFAEQVRLYEQAQGEYEKLFAEYRQAWEKFAQQPGVSRTGDSISYPSHMIPPQAPPALRSPVNLDDLPDRDIALTHLGVLIKGRTDEQLEKAFREGFARIGIALK